MDGHVRGMYGQHAAGGSVLTPWTFIRRGIYAGSHSGVHKVDNDMEGVSMDHWVQATWRTRCMRTYYIFMRGFSSFILHAICPGERGSVILRFYPDLHLPVSSVLQFS